MAGRVVVSTLNDDAGVLATQNGMKGIARAWMHYNQATSTISNSYNVSSVTNNGTGDFTINFTTAMPNANYCWAGSACFGNAGSQTNWLSAPVNLTVAQHMTTTTLRISNSYASNATNNNLPYNGVIVFSS